MRYVAIVVAGLLCALATAACSKGSKESTASADGAKLYLANCASCHQADGKGVAGTFPPLAGSEIANGDAVRAIHIVKYGLTGPLVVKGQRFNGMMPAWSPQLSDADIAAALTYVRSSWGDSASAVTAGQVATVSK